VFHQRTVKTVGYDFPNEIEPNLFFTYKLKERAKVLHLDFWAQTLQYCFVLRALRTLC